MVVKETGCVQRIHLAQGNIAEFLNLHIPQMYLVLISGVFMNAVTSSDYIEVKSAD
jgi:hypothetical protein